MIMKKRFKILWLLFVSTFIGCDDTLDKDFSTLPENNISITVERPSFADDRPAIDVEGGVGLKTLIKYTANTDSATSIEWDITDFQDQTNPATDASGLQAGFFVDPESIVYEDDENGDITPVIKEYAKLDNQVVTTGKEAYIVYEVPNADDQSFNFGLTVLNEDGTSLTRAISQNVLRNVEPEIDVRLNNEDGTTSDLDEPIERNIAVVPFKTSIALIDNTTIGLDRFDQEKNSKNNIGWIIENRIDNAGNVIPGVFIFEDRSKFEGGTRSARAVVYQNLGRYNTELQVTRRSPQALTTSGSIQVNVIDPEGPLLAKEDPNPVEPEEGEEEVEFSPFNVMGNTITITFNKKIAKLPSNIKDLFRIKIDGQSDVLSITDVSLDPFELKPNEDIDVVGSSRLILTLSDVIQQGDSVFLEMDNDTSYLGIEDKFVNLFDREVPNDADFYESDRIQRSYLDDEDNPVSANVMDLSFASLNVGDDVPYFIFRRNTDGAVFLPSEFGVTIKVINDPRPDSRDGKSIEIKIPVGFEITDDLQLRFVSNNMVLDSNGQELPDYGGYIPTGSYRVSYWEKLVINGVTGRTGQFAKSWFSTFLVTGGFAGQLGWYRRSDDFQKITGAEVEVKEDDKLRLVPNGPTVKGLGQSFTPFWRIWDGDFQGANGYSIILDDFTLIKTK